MKNIQLTVLLAGLLLNFKSEAQGTFDFQFGFQNTFSPNALYYVVQQQNIQQTSEGGNDVSYWNPINAGQTATLTQKFTFSGPTTQIFLNATIATYNFGGNEYGSGSLWASTDDVNWTLLENAPPPSSEVVGTSYPYAENLPSSLLGANQIYIQVQLNSSQYDFFAQFSRSGLTGDPSAPDIFDLDANYTTVPENSTMFLFGIGLAILVFTSKKIKRLVVR